MNNHAIRTARLTDRQIVDLIIAIRDDIGFDSATLRFGAGVSEHITPNTDETKLETYRGNSHAILSLDVDSNQSNLAIRFRRGTCPDSDRPDANRQASPYYDEIFVCLRDNNVPAMGPDVIIKCLDVIEKTLHEIPRILEGHGQDVIDTLRAEMSALNETYRRMIERSEDERVIRIPFDRCPFAFMLRQAQHEQETARDRPCSAHPEPAEGREAFALMDSSQSETVLDS